MRIFTIKNVSNIRKYKNGKTKNYHMERGIIHSPKILRPLKSVSKIQLRVDIEAEDYV